MPETRHRSVNCCCAMPASHCVCRFAPRLSSRVDFALLLHRKERERATNTGRFLAQCLAGTACFTWQREAPEPALLEWLKRDPAATFVLFPADRPELESRRASPSAFVALPRPRVLLLDGTWKQARKMLRKTPALDSLPLLSLAQLPESRYTLRRGAGQDQLCTLESAAAVMALCAEGANAAALASHLQRFCHHYQALRSNHLP